MATMEKLPDEVLSEIFIRLLAKQLAQMRSVCKPWNALLSDSSFIKSHLHRSINKKDEILLFYGLIIYFDHSPFTARLSRSPDLELANFIKPPAIPHCEYGWGVLIGSVNGLICFRSGSSPNVFLLHIWNPSLSAFLTLPPSSFPSTEIPFVLGFGFDPKTDDYKILKLESFSHSVKQAEVYSTRKGSWKLISPQSFPSHTKIPYAHNTQICVDDNLHWLCGTDLDLKSQTIVAFDLGEEAFTEIPLPEAILHFKVCRPFNVLGVLGGKLCVMSCVEDGEFEVWVMDEYGVPESWVKHLVFAQFSGDIVPCGFTSYGEFLFHVGVNDDRFGLYDPVAAKTKTFNITPRNSYEMKFAEYVDSLVWVAPPDRESKVERESKKRKQDIGARVKRSE